MSGIEDLQQRVAAVEQQFGLANEQRTKYSARLLGLMDAVEARLREQQTEIGRQADDLAQRAAEVTDLTARSDRGERENEQLRGMLHSLLQAIEAGSRDVLSDAMQTLDAKVSSLIAGESSESPQPDSEPEAGDAEAAVVAETASEAEAIDEPADEPAEFDAGAADEAAPEPAEVAEVIADEAMPEPAEADLDITDEAASETAEVAEAVADKAMPESAEADPDIVDEPAAASADAGAVISDDPPVIVQEDEAVDPADHAAPEVPDETAEATEPPAAASPSDEEANLAAIMQRVRTLIEEDEVPGAAEEAGAGGPADPAPETEVAEPAVAQAAVNT